MVQQTAVETVSQFEKKQSASLGWYSFVCSKIIAGFEAYGLALIGMMPVERR